MTWNIRYTYVGALIPLIMTHDSTAEAQNASVPIMDCFPQLRFTNPSIGGLGISVCFLKVGQLENPALEESASHDRIAYGSQRRADTTVATPSMSTLFTDIHLVLRIQSYPYARLSMLTTSSLTLVSMRVAMQRSRHEIQCSVDYLWTWWRHYL